MAWVDAFTDSDAFLPQTAFQQGPSTAELFTGKIVAIEKKLEQIFPEIFFAKNIDGLEHLAGIPSEKLVECHGHFRTASCIDCRKSCDGEQVKETIVAKGGIPKCSKCGGNVKPDIVFFGENLPARFYALLKSDIRKADLLIILGTSLQVSTLYNCIPLPSSLSVTSITV